MRLINSKVLRSGYLLAVSVSFQATVVFAQDIAPSPEPFVSAAAGAPTAPNSQAVPPTAPAAPYSQQTAPTVRAAPYSQHAAPNDQAPPYSQLMAPNDQGASYSQQASPSAPASQFAQPSASAGVEQAKPLVLQGSAIVHAEAMAPVAPQLQAGVEFDEQAMPKLQPNNDWYPIPAWYAGYKHIETQTILQDYNFATGQRISPNRTVVNRQDLPIGFQIDRNGTIWEFKRAPYSSTTDGGNTLTTTIIRSRDPIQVTQSYVVIRMVETSVVVNKRNRRILRSMQEEQINTFTPAGQGTMNLQTSIKSFGADGRPQVQETSVRVVSQIAPFQPINSYQGMDTRSMFRDFMIAKGWGNLLPDDLAPATVDSTAQGQAGYGQAGNGQAGYGQAGNGQAGNGQAGHGQAGNGQAGNGQAGNGQAGNGQAGYGQARNGQGGNGLVSDTVGSPPPSSVDDTTISAPGAPPVAPSRVP